MKLIQNSVEAIVNSIHRFFIGIVIASYVVAAIMPGFGLWIRTAEIGGIIHLRQLNFPLPLLMLASLLFNAGLGVKTKELTQLRHKPFMLVGGLLGNFAAPLIFIIMLSIIMKGWHNPEEIQQILVGLALVAAMPIAGASTAWAQNANGNLTLSLGLVLFTTLLSPVITPLVLHAVGLVTIDDYSEDLHKLAVDGVATFLGVWVILPSVSGIAMLWLIGERRIAAAKPYLKLINYTVLVLLNYSNASLTLPEAVANPDLDLLVIMLAIIAALCLTAFIFGYLLAHLFRAERNEKISLMFALGMKNNGTGLVLASIALADHPQIMLPIIFYNLVQHLMASLVDFMLFQQKPVE